jgi:hypothetical protein
VYFLSIALAVAGAAGEYQLAGLAAWIEQQCERSNCRSYRARGIGSTMVPHFTAVGR